MREVHDSLDRMFDYDHDGRMHSTEEAAKFEYLDSMSRTNGTGIDDCDDCDYDDYGSSNRNYGRTPETVPNTYYGSNTTYTTTAGDVVCELICAALCVVGFITMIGLPPIGALIIVLGLKIGGK